jgi:hypothetical protein
MSQGETPASPSSSEPVEPAGARERDPRDEEMTHRAALAIAERLGTEAIIFPSHHGGFLGGEFGWTGEPDAFAAIMRDVLAEGR